MTAGKFSQVLIIYHAGCMDGLFSAYAVQYWVPATEYVYCPAQYGDPVPEVGDYDWVYVVDFSYPADTMKKMIRDTEGRITCIDHHKTAAEELRGLEHVVFDMGRSGAALTWDYLNTYSDVPPWPIQYVEDRDLWKWKLLDSKTVNEYLRAVFSGALRDSGLAETGFKTFCSLVHEDANSVPQEWSLTPMDCYITTGSLLIRTAEEEITKQADRAEFEYVSSEHGVEPVYLLNTAYKISETLHYILKNKDCRFAVAWFKVPGKYVFSLRGRDDDDFDVSRIAKSLGGGGHPKAAGFTVDERDTDRITALLVGNWWADTDER